MSGQLLKKLEENDESVALSVAILPPSLIPPSLSFRWRPVGVEDGTEFQWLEQETVTNSSGTRHTVDKLQPYTVYTFAVTAINTVGRSAASKQSYPAVTLMESKYGKK